MTEETKRSGGFAIFKPSSDDKKSSPTASAAASASTKKVIIKSADMKDDMQKEAIDCALFAFDKHDMEKDITTLVVILIRDDISLLRLDPPSSTPISFGKKSEQICNVNRLFCGVVWIGKVVIEDFFGAEVAEVIRVERSLWNR